MRSGWPLARAGQRIGLLGGSFDPAHEGHAHITREALRRFELDQVWWLVSPGNPLKDKGPAPLAARVERAKAVMQHPRVRVSTLETDLKTRFTADMLSQLLPKYPGVEFVWLMGADNLADFHLWDHWQDIFAMVPIGVLARPGERLAGRLSPAARRFRARKLPKSAASLLARAPTPAWCFVNVPMSDRSSTEIRATSNWLSQAGATEVTGS